LNTGADDYLIKPFDPEELRVRIRNLIQLRRKLREKFRREMITEPVGQEIRSSEDTLLQKMLELLNQHLDEPEYNTDNMSDELNMSRAQMYRKINAITGYTPKELLRTIRLKKAASMFDLGHKNITQVMFEVGFNSPSYFAKSFKKMYHLNPSDYLRSRNR
jgi:AraC-like DNA-binding protein